MCGQVSSGARWDWPGSTINFMSPENRLIQIKLDEESIMNKSESERSIWETFLAGIKDLYFFTLTFLFILRYNTKKIFWSLGADKMLFAGFARSLEADFCWHLVINHQLCWPNYCANKVGVSLSIVNFIDSSQLRWLLPALSALQDPALSAWSSSARNLTELADRACCGSVSTGARHDCPERE